MRGACRQTICVTDGRSFVSYLDTQLSVDTNRKIGTMGYCMTGSYTMRLAAALPERIGAGGSFHGGGLATERDDSPHLLAPQMKAGFLIAIAENDDERDPDAKTTLRDAFDDAGVRAEIEAISKSAFQLVRNRATGTFGLQASLASKRSEPGSGLLWIS